MLSSTGVRWCRAGWKSGCKANVTSEPGNEARLSAVEPYVSIEAKNLIGQLGSTDRSKVQLRGLYPLQEPASRWPEESPRSSNRVDYFRDFDLFSWVRWLFLFYKQYDEATKRAIAAEDEAKKNSEAARNTLSENERLKEYIGVPSSMKVDELGEEVRRL